MLRVLRRGFLLCSFVVLPFGAKSQENPPAPRSSTEFVLTVTGSTFNLPHQFIVEGSDSLVLDSLLTLRRDIDYHIDHRRGIVRLDSTLLLHQGSDGNGTSHQLHVFYTSLPLHFQEEYFHRQAVAPADSLGEEIRVVPDRPSTWSLESVFGPNILKSGSIVRGFSVGTNQDLSLNSGFRMQFSGPVAPGVDVTAALTDENTPIQPEGNTQTLQEIDKVFVEVKGKDLGATLGDFFLDFRNSEFGRYDRKLQGAKGTANFHSALGVGAVTLSAASTKGKFTTNEFRGIEGVQGPYRLVGQNNERYIIVVAGTERVYIDGELMTRGEANDYIVDYGNGEITFMARRLITSASRIVVDFEYSERNYPRNLLATHVSSTHANDRVRWSGVFLREGDDQDSPTNLSFSDSDRQILAESGDDRLRASKSGVTVVERDSVTGLGKGQYAAADTVVGGVLYRMYRYVDTPDSTSIYAVVFSDVGQVPRDSLGYERYGIGRFRVVGLGKGRYLPIQTLPLAQLHQVADLSLSLEAVQGLTLSGELALSRFDANRFSSLDDDGNNGSARKFGLQWKSPQLHFGTADLGAVEFSLFERNIGRSFVAVDRVNEIEFNRKWNLVEDRRSDETIREGNLAYRPRAGILLSGGYGTIDRGGTFRSKRFESHTVVSAPNFPSVNYLLEIINSETDDLMTDAGWVRHKGFVGHRFGKLTPAFRFESESKETNPQRQGGILGDSFRYAEYAPKLTVADFLNMTFQTEFEWRTDELPLNGSLERESTSFTQRYAWRLASWRSLSSSVDVTFRKKTFAEQFKQQGEKDVETVLLRMQTKYAPLNRGIQNDVFYEVSTQRSSKLDRIFVQVKKGQGQYVWVDGNGNGVVDQEDPNDFKQARFDGDWILLTLATDELLPVVDLKTSYRFRFSPSRFIRESGGFLRKALTSISSETYVRLEEKSTESQFEKVYLLHLRSFQNENTTLSGSAVVTQDLYFFEDRKEFSVRLRFNQRKGLNQFSAGTDRTLAIERSLRVRWQLIPELSNQVDAVHGRDRLIAMPRNDREQDVATSSLASDFSYRPEQDLEVGFRVEVSRSEDESHSEPLIANLNAQSLRILYSFRGKGQARLDFNREEVTLTSGSIDLTRSGLPFELARGRQPGKTWIWRANLNYRVGPFVQLSMMYEGRSESGRPAVHSARSEVRAFF